ncbi:MAG: hypothetical protein IPG63_02750 [Xanthomonadales bacterium]|nr:hypothetical protein [Xanthomonadales bacterium]
MLDFNLYLSPYDVWSGAVYEIAGVTPAVLSTNDNSCTVPNIKTNSILPLNSNGQRYIAFRNLQYVNLTAFGGSNFNDAGPNGLDRTREGHLEMIEMAIVTNATEGSLDAITHDGTGVPADCPQVVTAWSSSASPAAYWRADPTIDTLPPTVENGGGGLFGAAAIVDVANGTQITYVPDAIDGFSVSNLHAAPGTVSPNLAQANFPTALGADAIVFNNGSLVTTSYPLATAIDAVSAVYMHDAIFNEYAVLSVGGTPILASEWVVTFPTKRFYVDKVAPAILPFQYVFAGAEGAGTAPVDIRLNVYNREEADGTSDCLDGGADACVDFSPSLPGTITTPQLYWEAQVVTFDQPQTFDATNAIVGNTLVLGSKLAANVAVGDYSFTEGWMKMRFWDDTIAPLNLHISRADAAGQRYVGMPVTGFWAENTQTTSVLANFAGIWKHKGSRCVVPNAAVPAVACPTN